MSYYFAQAGVALGFAQEIKEEYRQTFSASVAPRASRPHPNPNPNPNPNLHPEPN